MQFRRDCNEELEPRVTAEVKQTNAWLILDFLFISFYRKHVCLRNKVHVKESYKNPGQYYSFEKQCDLEFEEGYTAWQPTRWEVCILYILRCVCRSLTTMQHFDLFLWLDKNFPSFTSVFLDFSVKITSFLIIS